MFLITINVDTTLSYTIILIRKGGNIMRLNKKILSLAIIVTLIFNSISFNAFAEDIDNDLSLNANQSISVDTDDIYDDNKRDSVSDSIQKYDGVEEEKSKDEKSKDELDFKPKEEPEEDGTPLFGAPAPNSKIKLYMGTSYAVGSPFLVGTLDEADTTMTQAIWAEHVKDASKNLPQGLTFTGFNDTITLATYSHHTARGLTPTKTKDEVLAMWNDFQNGNITGTLLIGACYDLPVRYLKFTNDDTKGTFTGKVMYADEQKTSFTSDFNGNKFHISTKTGYSFNGWKRVSDGVLVQPGDLVWPHDKLSDWTDNVEYVADYSGHSKTLDSISIEASPSTVDYNVGDSFDPTGLQILATYDDSSTDIFLYAGFQNEFTFEPSVVDSTGKIKVKFRGKETFLYVNLITPPPTPPIPAKVVSSIAVKPNTVKTVYNSGDLFEPDNLVITVTYDNAYYPDEEIAYTGNAGDFLFDKSTLTASGNVTVTYKGTARATIAVARTERSFFIFFLSK